MLAAVRLGVLHDAGGLSPTGQLTFRVGNGRPRYPQPGVRCAHIDSLPQPGQLPLRVVPQLLWPGLLTDHLIDLPDDLVFDRYQDEGGRLLVGRACAAMFLARLGSTRPWRLIAIELGLPGWFADVPPVLHRRLVDGGRWSAFLADLDALAARLEVDPPPVDYRTRRWLCADPSRLLQAVRAGRQLAADLPPAVMSDELLARAFWQSYTGGDLRLAPPPLTRADTAATAADQARIRTLHRAAAGTLPAIQALLERSGLAGNTGPMLWSPAGSTPAQADPPVPTPWPLPAGVEPEATGGEHQIALSAALEAAEETLTEHAFQSWLWQWLGINYGIPDTDSTQHWPGTVWALRAALLDPDTDPGSVAHPDLTRALQHSTRTRDGQSQPWQLLRTPPAGVADVRSDR